MAISPDWRPPWDFYEHGRSLTWMPLLSWLASRTGNEHLQANKYDDDGDMNVIGGMACRTLADLIGQEKLIICND